MLYSTEDYIAASFRSTESEKTVKQPMGETRKKRPLESNGQTQEDKENVQVAPHVPVDGEKPTNVYSMPVHREAKAAHCSVPQSPSH